MKFIFMGTASNRVATEKYETRSQTLMGQQSISNVVLKNECSIMKFCQNINVHVVNTDICGDLNECLWIE